MARLLEEVADFLASNPTQEQLLNFQPSKGAQQRARELLARQKNARLSDEEHRELDQMEFIEMLLGIVKVKARLREGIDPSS